MRYVFKNQLGLKTLISFNKNLIYGPVEQEVWRMSLIYELRHFFFKESYTRTRFKNEMAWACHWDE
jgi:hypothetical protein